MLLSAYVYLSSLILPHGSCAYVCTPHYLVCTPHYLCARICKHSFDLSYTEHLHHSHFFLLNCCDICDAFSISYHVSVAACLCMFCLHVCIMRWPPPLGYASISVMSEYWDYDFDMCSHYYGTWCETVCGLACTLAIAVTATSALSCAPAKLDRHVLMRFCTRVVSRVCGVCILLLSPAPARLGTSCA